MMKELNQCLSKKGAGQVHHSQSDADFFESLILAQDERWRRG